MNTPLNSAPLEDAWVERTFRVVVEIMSSL
jgi:hypothetical protein